VVIGESAAAGLGRNLLVAEQALEATVKHYREEVEQIAKLEQAIDEAVKQAPVEIRVVIEALQVLRGVAQTAAATVVAELGSLARFETPRQLMGGAITKSGNAHLRRVLVEAAWTYRHEPTKRRTLEENCAVRSADPTRDFSPRQLPTDHVHAVPTRAYQSDQSSR
jgi:transposase